MILQQKRGQTAPSARKASRKEIWTNQTKEEETRDILKVSILLSFNKKYMFVRTL